MNDLNGAIVDGPFRYRLWRTLRVGDGPRAVFVMLNPSTADGRRDDPTLRRCIGFAHQLGAHRLDVVNLFAWRATNPDELARAPDPVGPHNDRHIVEACVGALHVIAAWGGRGGLFARDLQVGELLRAEGVSLECLGTTGLCYPRHPLYLPKSAELAPYTFPADRVAAFSPRTA